MKLLKVFAGLISFLICLHSCSNQDISGNGTRIGNPKIAITGALLKPDGKTPAKNATVWLRKKDALIDINSRNLKKTAEDTATVTTDEKGMFTIGTIDPGLYVIECTDGNNNYAMYDSVAIENSDTSVVLPADTLKPAGAIGGTVKLAMGGNPENVYIMVFGILRFATVDGQGSFILNNLAEGNYDLKIISSDENYGFMGMHIRVETGDTTYLDNIELPFTGTPLIKNLSANYDTLNHIASLTWDPIDTSLIMGFNVYRSVGSSTYEKYNDIPFLDVKFRDTIIFTNNIYSYRISVVKKDSTESAKSQPLTIQSTTFFPLIDTMIIQEINQGGGKRDNPHILMFANGSFYACVGSSINKYDTNFNFISSLSNDSLVKPMDLAAGGDGRIYAADMYGEKILKILVYSQNGTLEKTWYLGDGADNGLSIGINAYTFAVNSRGHLIFVSGGKDSVYVCDTSGTIIKSWGGFGNGTGIDQQVGITALSIDSNDNIYLYEFIKGISVYDSNGVFIRMISTDEIGYPFLPGFYITSMAVEPQTGRIFASYGSGFAVFTPDGELITYYQKNGVDQILLIGKAIYFSTWITIYNGVSGTVATGITKLRNSLR